MPSPFLWAIAAVVFVTACLFLRTRWKAAAPPGAAEIEAFSSSGEPSTIINGWEIISGGAGLPEEDRVVADSGNATGLHEERSWFEAYVLRPVSPMAKVRQRALLVAWFATGWWKSRTTRRAPAAPTTQALRSATKEVMILLAQGDYEQLVARCSKSRLSASDLNEVIRAYGRTVVVPPPAAYDLLYAARIEATTVPTWYVNMPLWTREEGRSDLTIELTIAFPEGKARIELDDLHVL